MPPSRPDDNPNANKVSARPPIGGPPGKPVVAGGGTAVAEPPKGANAGGGDSLLVPGDETHWERYSPNGEPIVSGFGSLMLHGFLLFMVLVGLSWLFSGGPQPDLEDLEPVEIGNGEDGGGGGSKEGVGGAPGNLTRPEDEIKKLEEDKTPKPMIPTEDDKIQKSKPEDIDPTDIVMEKMKKPEAKKLGPVIKDAMEGMAGFGKGGTGQGGGEGTGQGTGRGSGTGPGTGRTNRRGARNLRWEISFGQSEARQYMQQTDAVGMVLVVPDKNGNPYRVADIHQKPAKLDLVDIKSLKDSKGVQMNWMTDDRQDSCSSVADALALNFVPVALLFFYPTDFEEKLLRAELAYKGRKEEDIQATKFYVSFSGGKPTVRVMEQTPKPGRK
jgi:hypothetical protein